MWLILWWSGEIWLPYTSNRISAHTLPMFQQIGVLPLSVCYLGRRSHSGDLITDRKTMAHWSETRGLISSITSSQPRVLLYLVVCRLNIWIGNNLKFTTRAQISISWICKEWTRFVSLLHNHLKEGPNLSIQFSLGLTHLCHLWKAPGWYEQTEVYMSRYWMR